MASIAMMVGGAIVNALAFSGSNYLFSTLRKSNAKEVEEERKRHNKTLEQLEAAQSQWTRRRMERLDFIHEELRKQGHSKRTMSQFYTPSEEQKDCEIKFIIKGLTAVLILGYTITTHKP